MRSVSNVGLRLNVGTKSDEKEISIGMHPISLGIYACCPSVDLNAKP